jgi:hypothetical protein
MNAQEEAKILVLNCNKTKQSDGVGYIGGLFFCYPSVYWETTWFLRNLCQSCTHELSVKRYGCILAGRYGKYVFGPAPGGFGWLQS